MVEVRGIDGLPAAFASRIAEGYIYGDFQYSIDAASDGFLRDGVFSCYRPVAMETPIPAGQKALYDRAWSELLYLAHADKAAAFRRYADYYLSTNGQVYWADEQQMSIYPDGYHAAVDERTGGRAPASEAITEIYCEVETCYPQFAEFLSLKRKYDPREVFQSDWYRHYRALFG